MQLNHMFSLPECLRSPRITPTLTGIVVLFCGLANETDEERNKRKMERASLVMLERYFL